MQLEASFLIFLTLGSIKQSNTLLLLLSLNQFKSTPEPRVHLDHEGNHTDKANQTRETT